MTVSLLGKRERERRVKISERLCEKIESAPSADGRRMKDATADSCRSNEDR